MIRTREIGSGGMYLKALIYAPYGVGKTLFSCGAALHEAMGPALLVNIEGGGMSASTFPHLRETEQIGQFSDVTEVFWNLANGSKDEETGEDWGAYKTVVVDSGSALQDMNIMEVAHANKTGSKPATAISQRDWGDSTRQVGELLRKFKTLPMNVLVTARQRDGFPEGMDDAKKSIVGPTVSLPDFTPALRRLVAHTFDHVWAMRSDEEGERQMLFQSSGPYTAKTRGAQFAAALGSFTTIKNPDNPESPGMSIGDIYDLYIETQGKQ